MHEKITPKSYSPEELEKLRERARQYTLLTNVFMKYALKDTPACQHILRIILGKPDLIIDEPQTEQHLYSPTSHEAILDVWAKDSTGKLYNIEIQYEDDDDHARRCRFYSAIMDCNYFPKGLKYKYLADSYMIYITKDDIWKRGRTIDVVSMHFDYDNELFEDGRRTIFVNTAVDDGTEIAKLMQYFKTTNPLDMSQGELSKRINLIKCQKEGERILDMMNDETYKDGHRDGVMDTQRNTTMNMLRKGFSDKDIMEIAGISLEALKSYKAEFTTM